MNLLPLEEGERITVVSPVREFESNLYVVMATANGIIKKTSLSNFSRPRPSGIIAVKLADGDHLIGAILTDGSNDLMLVSSNGKAIRFSEERVREMGRAARGVRGIAMDNDAEAIALISLVARKQYLRLLKMVMGSGQSMMSFLLEEEVVKGDCDPN